jgi:hypothetical protein
MVESSFSFFVLSILYFASIVPDRKSLFFNDIEKLFIRIPEKIRPDFISDAKMQQMIRGNITPPFANNGQSE